MPDLLELLSQSLVGKQFRGKDSRVYVIVKVRPAHLVEGLRADVKYQGSERQIG